eukprot:gnl/MRDRNA2_/MRDRNA2_168990_c0_seq1.p1 gnl/MRDRNA2_/MRDRNA2_168990_c0~~gnl/MRDRNA2_/MRDRNA2_168990_c0_seq1.p1  ORF type:complete len:300 (-),score=45.86 gnl/MRDRNA2_/MRDRNA2_168990_c0_seq1:140-1039(-)
MDADKQDEHQTLLNSSEVRVASDGQPYTLEAFKTRYPETWQNDWDLAKAVPTAQVAPKGLKLGSVSESLVKQVCAEIMPYFPSGDEKATLTHRAALEVGWTLDHSSLARTKQVAVKAECLDKFPALRTMLSSAMRELKGDVDLNESCLNVSCLLYLPGTGIEWHSDRPHCYDKDVFGCIMFNSSDCALEFHELADDSAIAQRYVMPESPGLCFLQSGPARFEWRHGVIPLSRGERLSVTWRWFLPEVQLKSEEEPDVKSPDAAHKRHHDPDGDTDSKTKRMRWNPFWNSSVENDTTTGA